MPNEGRQAMTNNPARDRQDQIENAALASQIPHGSRLAASAGVLSASTNLRDALSALELLSHIRLGTRYDSLVRELIGQLDQAQSLLLSMGQGIRLLPSRSRESPDIGDLPIPPI